MIEKIRELRAQSLPLAEIARQCGLTVGQVKYQLKKSKRHSNVASISVTTQEPESLGAERNQQTHYWKLPSFYGDNLIKLLAQGPTVLFAYWEITWPRMRMVASYLQTDYRYVRKGIRLYDVTDCYFNGANAHSYRDLIVEESSFSCYIRDCQPGRTYIADFGLFHGDRFCPILRSEPIATPRNQPAPWGDPLVSPAPSAKYPAWFENFNSYSVYSK